MWSIHSFSSPSHYISSTLLFISWTPWSIIGSTRFLLRRSWRKLLINFDKFQYYVINFFKSENKHQNSSIYLIIPVIIFKIFWGYFEYVWESFLIWRQTKFIMYIIYLGLISIIVCAIIPWQFSIFDYSVGYHLKYLGIILINVWAIIPLFTIFHYAWDYTSDSKSK